MKRIPDCLEISEVPVAVLQALAGQTMTIAPTDSQDDVDNDIL